MIMKHAATLLLALALVLCLTAALCACGKTDPAPSGTESAAVSEPSGQSDAGTGPSFDLNGNDIKK